MSKDLEAKVKAVNRANEYANKWYRILRPIFEPLVGTKILTVNGSLTNKVEKLMPELPCGVHVYKCPSDYRLTWNVQTCESIPPYGCCYHETPVTIGNLDGQILKEIVDFKDCRTDYSAAEVERLRAEYKKAKEAADEALYALFPFGEYDH